MPHHATRSAFAGLCALVCAMGIGRFAYTPMLPRMLADAGLSAAAGGLIASANFIGYLAGALLASSAFFGRRRLLWARVGLAGSIATTATMGLPLELIGWSIVRFFSGIGSAFVLVFASGLVLESIARAGRPTLSALPYAGVGIGIALSSVLIEIAARAGSSSAAMWWLLGLAALLFGAVGAVNLGSPRLNPASQPDAPAGVGSPPGGKQALAWLTAAYGCMGFGYVVTATFLVLMVRQLQLGTAYETLAWVVTGLAAIPSNPLWMRAAQRWGDYWALAAAFVLQAVGVMVAAVAGGLAGVLIGAALLGGTFMAITALILPVGRRLGPDHANRTIGRLTAAFGFGQIFGPAMAGWMADRSGSFLLPSSLAASVLLAGAIMIGVARRCLR